MAGVDVSRSSAVRPLTLAGLSPGPGEPIVIVARSVEGMMGVKHSAKRTIGWPLSLALAATVLSVVTAIRPAWVELLSGAEPDNGDGSFEWLIVALFAAFALAMYALTVARYLRWRQAPSPSS